MKKKILMILNAQLVVGAQKHFFTEIQEVSPLSVRKEIINHNLYNLFALPIDQGPVARKCVKFNQWLGET